MSMSLSFFITIKKGGAELRTIYGVQKGLDTISDQHNNGGRGPMSGQRVSDRTDAAFQHYSEVGIPELEMFKQV